MKRENAGLYHQNKLSKYFYWYQYRQGANSEFLSNVLLVPDFSNLQYYEEDGEYLVYEYDSLDYIGEPVNIYVKEDSGKEIEKNSYRVLYKNKRL